jgi:excisionase family DNA binding protein
MPQRKRTMPQGKRFASVQEGIQYHQRLASIREAAAYGAVSEKTIRRYISDGTLTGYRLGKKLLRVDLTEIDSLLKRIPTASGGGQ